MSFNSVTLTIAGAIFVVLLAMTAYFIYQDQKSKFSLIQATCPDYWLLKKHEDGPSKGKYYCEPSSKNMGTCSSSSGQMSGLSFQKLENTNCVGGRLYNGFRKDGSKDDYKYLGDFNSYEECLSSPNIPATAKAITYHNDKINGWAKQCFSINDTKTRYPNQNYATCGIIRPGKAPAYNVINDNNECTNYKNKMTWVNNVCGQKVLWNGVTNNAELKGKCK